MANCSTKESKITVIPTLVSFSSRTSLWEEVIRSWWRFRTGALQQQWHIWPIIVIPPNVWRRECTTTNVSFIFMWRNDDVSAYLCCIVTSHCRNTPFLLGERNNATTHSQWTVDGHYHKKKLGDIRQQAGSSFATWRATATTNEISIIENYPSLLTKLGGGRFS